MKKPILFATCWLLAKLCYAIDPDASLEAASSEILPTPYRIRIHLGRDIPQSQVGKRMFTIHEKDTDQVVPIISVRRGSAPDANVPDPTVKTVILDAELDPSHSYTVDISFPDGTMKPVPVSPLHQKENTASPPPLINLNSRSFSLEANPFVANGDKGIGLKYDVRYDVRDLHPGSALLRIELQTHGEVSLTAQNDSRTAIQNSFNGGVDAVLLYNVSTTLYLGSESRAYVYPMGVKVAPAEFEANRDFSLVNYSAKVVAGGAIPYADYPAILWSRLCKLEVPFFAPTLFTGVAALSDVKDDGTDELARLGRVRWDTEFLYFIPLHQRLDFKFSWNWYVGLEKSLWKNNYEVGLILYADEKRSQGFTLSYQQGSLPPEFVHTHSWRIGYIGKF